MSDYETILDLNAILKLTKLKFIDFLTLMALAGKFNRLVFDNRYFVEALTVIFLIISPVSRQSIFDVGVQVRDLRRLWLSHSSTECKKWKIGYLGKCK